MAHFEKRLVPSVFVESVLKILTSSGLMSYMNPQHIFVTVHDAVLYIQQQKVSAQPQMLICNQSVSHESLKGCCSVPQEKPPESTTTVWVWGRGMLGTCGFIWDSVYFSFVFLHLVQTVRSTSHLKRQQPPVALRLDYSNYCITILSFFSHISALFLIFWY